MPGEKKSVEKFLLLLNANLAAISSHLAVHLTRKNHIFNTTYKRIPLVRDQIISN